MNLDEALPFLEQLHKQLLDIRMDITAWEIDHICYRTSSIENYLTTIKETSSLGDLLIESEVNGRMISTYRLHHPIEFKHWKIGLLEIPAPKSGRVTPEGFEHIEVVIHESFESLMKKYPWLRFNLKAIDKKINPDIELELKNCAIKFHHKSLEEIIEIEKYFTSKTNQ